ncbi:MAG: UvrD-helicase domain-containing protein [Bacteroidia bacterium]|nr:UvrD-helicase domain-containing protein [Bacteroidia bacterium]
MGKGTLTIYSASAGSGKTYILTGIYLTNLFKSRYNYRRILAVTFTNKATAEMKSRILDNLHKLAVGENSEYLPALIKATNRTEEWIRNEAKEILDSILHDFSRFSVSTIDSFFQKILRAFTREVGLHPGFNIELDHSTILSSAVDEMIASAASDNQLKNWLTTYAMSNIDKEKSWNLKDGIIKLAEELFKEKFKILSTDERSNLENKKFLLEYIEKIKSVSSSFEKKLLDYGKRADEIFSKFELSDDMFYRKGKGVPGFIRFMVSGIVKEPNSWVREIENDPPRWSTGITAPQLQAAINSGMEKTLKEVIHYYDENIVEYNSADAILSYIYALGILSDVLHNVHLITTSENSFLLSDAGELLNLITQEDQSPFIYEKVGNKYENFMIDEFQDTSIIQWNNFRPLIENSMAEGFDNLIVGDVKQSIYRWRNSDWKILGSVLDKLVDNDRFISEPLTTNWRSRSNIIKFNNTLFTIIPGQVDETLAGDTLPVSFRKLYSEAVQADPGKSEGGYIRLEFIENEKERKWQEIVLERIPGVIESFQDKGYNASDIGIIVRDGKEGAQILKTIIDYSNNSPPENKQAYNYNVVSNDSLLLSNSPVIIFIIAVISVVNDPQDIISRAMMLRFFLLAKGDEEADKVALVSDKLIEASRVYFPEGYETFLERIKQMPLFEATESIIRFFGLGEYSCNVAYLNTFQDYIVSFTGNKNADIQSFLDWWEATGKNKSVVLPGNQDAMRILTIHKSKGLEFKVVILPFLSWNLDHIPSNQPILWVKPTIPPFNELGIVPVKYNKELSGTIFADDYKEEKYSVYLDNINLLYVALTRAKDAIYGFSVDNPRSESTIAGVLKNVITLNTGVSEASGFVLNSFYNSQERVFEFGEIPENKKEASDIINLISSKYSVSQEMESLKLKLHGENYFSSDKVEVRKKINYGKLMHEVFEGINTPADISFAVRKLVLEGKLPEEESADTEKRVNSLISTPQVAGWFLPGNEVMTEAGILLPTGITRRPDRVIFKDGKTIIIDFKFGEENPHYAEQVDRYRCLLIDMGYQNIEAYIWYVDKNKIVSA